MCKAPKREARTFRHVNTIMYIFKTVPFSLVQYKWPINDPDFLYRQEIFLIRVTVIYFRTSTQFEIVFFLWPAHAESKTLHVKHNFKVVQYLDVKWLYQVIIQMNNLLSQRNRLLYLRAKIGTIFQTCTRPYRFVIIKI